MLINREKSLNYIFIAEGGFAARDSEPGGSVNMGISQQTLAAWRKKKGSNKAPTIEDVKHLTKVEAAQIYTNDFMSPIAFDTLASGLDYCIFDAAVNEGMGGTLRTLADLIGYKYIGTRPIASALAEAANKVPVSSLIDRICDVRLIRKKKLPNWTKFGLGWTNRIEAVRKHAKAMENVG